MSNDFNPQDRDWNRFINDPLIRELADTEFCSLSGYTDEEIRQSVVQDILTITFWEKTFGEKKLFNLLELLKFVHRDNLYRVLDALHHPEVSGLVERTKDGLRIRNNRSIEQHAMDYCGVYMSGYDMPEGTIVTNRQEAADTFRYYGSVENMAAALAMDLQASFKFRSEHKH